MTAALRHDLRDGLHQRLVFPRRIQRLCDHIAPLLPPRASVLDCGCGDGALAERLLALRPDLQIRGVDVLVRPGCKIPVDAFDGRALPHRDASFDCALLVDVLHHAEEPAALLGEVARVAPHRIVVKDHLADGFAARPTLRFMDRVGNARHGVALPFSYLTAPEWAQLIASLGLAVEVWLERLSLYPPPLSWLFDRRLHFIAALSHASRGG
jgi:SAM-dependent methyltransferase